jgi:CheY-like chemotaxis protein
LSWAQILRLKDGADAAHTRKAVALIEKSGKDLGQLIEDLLDISSIQAGKVRLELREIDPLECIAAALDSVRTQADDKSIAIQTEFEPPSCRIQADSARLQQVFGNLLTNAVKFTPAGGTVTVRTKRQTTQLEIQVQDTGKGITPEFLPYVFKRFSQEDSSPKRAFGGLGLGLSIARSLAGLHGGTVTADSPGEGKGAVFTVTLPCGAACLPHEACATSESDQITTLRSERPARLTGLRVLVIDDQPVAREVVSALLEPLGAQVQSAGNAREGLAILASDRPDIVLCDLSMPGEDGFDVIREARALDPGEGGTVPIVALTAYAEGETVRRCIDAGFAAHMAKPMDAVDLARLITRLVERPTPAS